jgi:hypothetical protein
MSLRNGRISRVEMINSLHERDFEVGEKVKTRESIKQSFTYELGSIIFVNITNNIASRTALAEIICFREEQTGMSTLELRKTVPLNTPEDLTDMLEMVDSCLGKTLSRKSQSGAEFLTSLLSDGRPVNLIPMAGWNPAPLLDSLKEAE